MTSHQDIITFSGEIVDIIIDYLHDDFDTLKSCSLVCHAWLPASRFHLFDVVTCLRGQDATLKHFLAWAMSSPDATPYIRTVIIQPVSEKHTRQDDAPMWLAPLQPIGLMVEDIGMLARSLNNLQHIVLRSVFLSASSSFALSSLSISSNRPSLSALSILHCSTVDYNFTPVYLLLSFFSEINTLEVVELKCNWDPSDMSIPTFASLASSLRVRELLLSTYTGRTGGAEPSQCFLRLFYHSRPTWYLSSLSLCLMDLTYQRLLDGIFPLCNGTLRELTIDITPTILIRRINRPGEFSEPLHSI